MNSDERPASRLAARARRWLLAVDRAQQDRPWLAVPVATWKKFGDDQAGNLAALIAYYGFASLFPLLLVAITILDIVASTNAALGRRLSSALHDYPVVGPQLEHTIKHGLGQTGLALAFGILLTLYAARGVASAMQNAMNAVWGVPLFRRPGFPKNLLRSFGLIALIGPGEIVTIALSSFAGGAGDLGGAGAKVAAVAVSLVLNTGLFWLGFKIATSAQIPRRYLRLSAILAALAWQVLQIVGGRFVDHATNSAYGTFGVVLGLLAWFYVQAQITLYIVELNVVRANRLYPRALAPPPLSEADLSAYRFYAQAGQRRPEVEIEVRPNPAAAVEAGKHRRQ